VISMQPLNRIMRTLGVRLMFAVTINFYIWLFVALGTNGKSVTVYFNHFGEAYWEFAIYLIVLPVILYSMFREYMEYRRKKKSKVNA